MNRPKAFLLVWFLLATPLGAVDTSFWQVGTFEEFLQGTLHDVSLSQEGELTLAPETRALFNPDETLALSLAADRKGNVFIGTGHQGKVFRVDANQKGSLLFTAREPEIFALAVAPDGSLFVASSPEGKIYRITLDGKSSEFFDPKTKYIWSLALDSKGNLFAATGDQGKIFKISPDGKGDVFYDSKQTHIMCLTFDREGNLLAGSVPNGIVYRIKEAEHSDRSPVVVPQCRRQSRHNPAHTASSVAGQPHGLTTFEIGSEQACLNHCFARRLVIRITGVYAFRQVPELRPFRRRVYLTDHSLHLPLPPGDRR
ncbi:MAG: SMP-30/gluconolactonase/LRE family protein [Acidobacteriia bacterium]|nr:SMP-30/gluconolactonase/LRE family protein [Terriglobia bacterium]